MRASQHRGCAPGTIVVVRRRAMITVAVLVCLIVITLMAATLLRLARSHRVLLRIEERSLQADWLAESALRRASARLSGDAQYAGETWSIPARDLGGPDPGVVTISVRPHEDGASRRRVTVQADYPSGTDQRARRTRQAVVDLAGLRAGRLQEDQGALTPLPGKNQTVRSVRPMRHPRDFDDAG